MTERSETIENFIMNSKGEPFIVQDIIDILIEKGLSVDKYVDNSAVNTKLGQLKKFKIVEPGEIVSKYGKRWREWRLC